MDVCGATDIHEVLTQRSRLSYCFTPKHHGAGDRDASRWLRTLSRAEEFQVFNMADIHELRDDEGNLYGLRIQQTGTVRQLLELGEAHEQIAQFWFEEREDAHWHGYPLWPVRGASQKCRPPKEVFDRMVAEALLSAAKARRLRNGSHVRNL
jgi:hypothetical protein